VRNGATHLLWRLDACPKELNKQVTASAKEVGKETPKEKESGRMFLKWVDIANFRGIKKLSLNLDETTVLIGGNNTTKTSILDASSLV